MWGWLCVCMYVLCHARRIAFVCVHALMCVFVGAWSPFVGDAFITQTYPPRHTTSYNVNMYLRRPRTQPFATANRTPNAKAHGE